jgi:hypothetical protein
VEALLDPKTLLLALFQFTQNVPNGGAGSVRSTFFVVLVIMIPTQSDSLLQL